MDDAEKFTWQLTFAILLILAITLTFALQKYQHPDPVKDCSKPELYPICNRATIPKPLPEPPMIWTYISVALTAIFAVILIRTSYRASVIEQAHIITPTASMAKKEE